MNTREEAVEYLRAQGLHAEKRDWALGKTIFARTGRSEAAGITVYARAMYIAPKGDSWVSLELDWGRPEDEHQVTLGQACARVVEILTAPRQC
jgi:hypothetical protein